MRWTSSSRSIGPAVGADSLCACRCGSSRRCAGEFAPRGQAPHSGAGGEKETLSSEAHVRSSQRLGSSSPCSRRLAGTWPMALDFPVRLGVAVSGLQLSKGRLVTVFLSQVDGGRRPPGEAARTVSDRSGACTPAVIAKWV